MHVVKFSAISPKYGDTKLPNLGPSKHYFSHMLIHQVILLLDLSGFEHLKRAVQLLHV
jgi:hypothetical protein